MHSCLYLLSWLAIGTAAFPWAAQFAGSESSSTPIFKRQAQSGTCPVHAVAEGAIIDDYYPSKYLNASNGLPSNGKGGILVPPTGDTAHQFTAPASTDIRGPCPALNMGANHNYLSHDGLTNYDEMVDFAQNIFNWEYDLAVFVASFGVIMDGNVLTGDMSIGCNGGAQVPDTGLNTHDKFEADTSIARTDYFLSPVGDSYSVNETLFNYWNDYCDGDFTLECMGPYQGARYNQSLATNGNFFYGPLGLFVLGTAALPSQSFASLGNEGTPDVATIAPFWAATKATTGDYTVEPGYERIPADWYNRPSPLSFLAIFAQVEELYVEAGSPPFGGNTGSPNSFVGLTVSDLGITDGVLANSSAAGIACLFYQILTDFIPLSLDDNLVLPLAEAAFGKAQLGDQFAQFDCPSL